MTNGSTFAIFGYNGAMDARTAHILNQMTAQFYARNAGSFSATRQNSWPGWNAIAGLLAGGGMPGAGPGTTPHSTPQSTPSDTRDNVQNTTCGASGGATGEAPLAVADAACGNGRFLKFLREQFPTRPISYAGWDGGPALLAEAKALAASEGIPARITECDIIGRLLDGHGRFPVGTLFSEHAEGRMTCHCSTATKRREESPSTTNDMALATGIHEEPENVTDRPTFDTFAPISAFDMVACFGFFHHVPGQEARQQLLQELLALAKPGGLVAVSLWRFADHPPLREKAQRSTQKALEWWNHESADAPLDLDPGDYLLGWGEPAATGNGATAPAFRYCHSFSDDEIDALVASAAPNAFPEVRYFADGRTGRLNTYLVFRDR